MRGTLSPAIPRTWYEPLTPTSAPKPYPVRSRLQVSEVVRLHPRHPPVLLHVLPHLQVLRVGDEERVGSRHGLIQLLQLRGKAGVP